MDIRKDSSGFALFHSGNNFTVFKEFGDHSAGTNCRLSFIAIPETDVDTTMTIRTEAIRDQ